MSDTKDGLHLDEYGFIVECTCGKCGERFPVDMAAGYNYTHLRDGVCDAPKCPFCVTEGIDDASPAVGTLAVINVDLTLLEKQRKSLQHVVNCLLVGYKLPGVTTEDVENLEGLENMLDAWSDERYFANKNE
jgi:hypothetical protein